MSALFRYVGPRGFEGRATIEIDGIQLVPRRFRAHQLKVTISIRPSEWLDPPEEPLVYRDRLLAGESEFQVQGLSRAELAAEKVLAWCSKDLPKHFVDLAYLKREYNDGLDYERIGSLVRRKFVTERNDGRYRALGITNVSQLGPFYTDERRIARLVHGDWQRLARDELIFLPQELGRKESDRLTESANTERFALEFWGSIEQYLR